MLPARHDDDDDMHTRTYIYIYIFVYNIDIICIQEHAYYFRELEIKYDIGKEVPVV